MGREEERKLASLQVEGQPREQVSRVARREAEAGDVDRDAAAVH